MHKFYFFALGAYGSGISGGDRIFIEFARIWSKKHKITIFLTKEGYEMAIRQSLNSKLKTQSSKLVFKVYNVERWKKFGFVVEYVARIVCGIWLGLTLVLPRKKPSASSIQPLAVYSCSEFWMDSIPAFIIKLRNRKTTWVAAWYQSAPNPLKGFAEGERAKKYRLKALAYWLLQLPIKPLISGLADYVVVNNIHEENHFPAFKRKKKLITLLGAIPLRKITSFQRNYKRPKKFTYDAVFQGRFHPQKGVTELIDIWKKVTEKLPNAKLAMVGDGMLREAVESRIKNYELSKNIKLLGYLFDGPEKYKVFNESKIVVHPALFDSGGMASAEAMAFGSPCVGFDLKSYNSYYPKGMIKAPVGDLNKFADLITQLLKDEKLRKKIGEEAKREIIKNWSWEKRARQVLVNIT